MYELNLAWRSIRRTPGLSLLIVGAVGLGIGVFMILMTAYHLLQRDPLPGKSDVVYRVMVDSWGIDDEFAGGIWGKDVPPLAMTYQDAMAIHESDIPTHQAVMFPTIMYLRGGQTLGERPFQVKVRVTTRGFFPMFDTPFLYGTHWNEAADDGPEPVIVLSKKTNQRLFGGDNSVGQSVELDGIQFRVTGVLDDWAPLPLFYNFLTLGVGTSPPEDVFIPFHFLERFQLPNNGASMGWKSFEPGFENMLQSESTWLQFWVELDDDAQKQRYLSFLDSYALSQREVGRFERPLNNRVYNVREWIKVFTTPMTSPALAFLLLGLLYLFVCLVNLISMLLGKFTSKLSEISLRRALGASRGNVFRQHLYEVCLLGVFGGALGIALSQAVLTAVRVRFDLIDEMFTLDWYLLTVAFGLSLVSGIIAGAIPAWRASNTAPVTWLKAE